jgi:hypothetical protein
MEKINGWQRINNHNVRAVEPDPSEKDDDDANAQALNDYEKK